MMGLGRNKALIFTALLALLALLLVSAAAFWRSADQRRLNEVIVANCNAIEDLKAIQRRALTKQIAASEQFLREHPDGIPGISPELIKQGIERQRHQVFELAPQEC